MISKKISKGKLLLSVSSVVALATTTSLAIFANNINNSSIGISDQSVPLGNSQRNADTNEIKPLVPAQSNGQNSFLSTSQGPLVYWNNKITSLDWYGAERWSIDFSDSQYTSVKKFTGAWLRAWFNWDYDRARNILWVLGYGDSSNEQKLFAVDATNGEVKKTIMTGSRGNLRFISALSSGNVLMWDGATNSYNATAKLYDSQTEKVSDIAGNSATAMNDISGSGTGNNSSYRWYFTNTIPIKSGYNFVVLMSFSTKSTTNDAGSVNANYNVYFVLVDDNLNLIANSGKWSKGQLVAEGMPGYRNTTISAQKDYYQLVDGTVATIIYNKIIMINPNDVNAENNVSFSTFTPSEVKWILSWSFDTSENLFFKYKDDTKIYKVNSSNLKTGKNDSVTASTYYDLSSSGNAKIKKYASNFVLYNVYGYQGQIMLVNAWYNDYINIYDSSVPDVSAPENNTEEYGLVAAITQNTSNPDNGDSKGLLNTADAFQFSADFSIQPQVLNSKLPSEIVMDDLTITNDGFITKNPKYPTPFTKIMDDENGTLEVTAYIDQIPWFVTNGQMPVDINPTQITKKYDNLNQVNSRISWKDSSTDYDFKNTLPSKVNDTDLKRFDPATFNINSQTIADGSGNIIYPKKEYKILEKNDTTRVIKIQANYEYMPLGVNGVKENAKNVTVEHEYTIFKNDDTKKFSFTGAVDGNAGKPIDVSTVPQLSSLLESQILPSTFVSSINSASNGYLQFVNTDLSSGYPTSKMKFSFVPNDDSGTLTITATLPADYYSSSSDNTFTQTYTGLNMNKDYLLSWNDSPKDINITQLLPSEITDSSIFGSFLNYKGFNPLDINIQLQPDDDSGTLNVVALLQKEYNEKVKTANGFIKLGNSWMNSHMFKGFLTKDQQNNQFKLVFKNDSDSSLNALKKYTTQQISEALKENGDGLTLNGTKYGSLKDLVSGLLISSKGVSLPNVSEADVKVTMYYNNGNGTADFVVEYPASVNNLIFVGTFTGFVLGNDVPTSDVLSFKTQLALEADVKAAKSNEALYNLFNKTVLEAKDWIEKSGNINNLISYTTGQYSNLLTSKDYTLTITTNEIYGTISAILEFDRSKISEKNSVSTFAFTYTGFRTGVN